MMNFTVTKVKTFLDIKGNDKDAQIEALIPSTIRFVEDQTGMDIPYDDVLYELDEGLAFIISKFIEYFMKDAGVKGYSLSRESVTYSDTIPSYLMTLLAPYKTGGAGGGIQYFPVGRKR